MPGSLFKIFLSVQKLNWRGGGKHYFHHVYFYLRQLGSTVVDHYLHISRGQPFKSIKGIEDFALTKYHIELALCVRLFIAYLMSEQR